MTYLGYVFLSICLGVVSQLIIKWKMTQVHFSERATMYEKFEAVFFMLFDPLIILSGCFIFLAGLAWMIAMTKLDLSYAYPFTALGFVLILVFSVVFFNEQITFEKITGLLLIALGVFLSSRSI